MYNDGKIKERSQPELPAFARLCSIFNVKAKLVWLRVKVSLSPGGRSLPKIGTNFKILLVDTSDLTRHQPYE